MEVENQDLHFLREYFELKAQGNRKKTLLMKNEKEYNCETADFHKYLEQIKAKHVYKINHNIDESTTKQIRQTLLKGRNICLYGRGSKIEFLKQLAKSTFPRAQFFMIRGYLNTLNEKIILNQIGEYLSGLGILQKGSKWKMNEQIKEYREALEKEQNQRRIYIMFHNIDGLNILNYQAQLVLSELFRSPYIQLMATIDNIKIMMNWSPDIIANYRFNFYHVKTQQPYVEQLKYTVQRLRKKDKLQEALKFIWASLNKNQKDILKVLARKELKNFTEGIQEYYSFQELYEVCVNEIILSSEYQLRENLVELLDHKVVEEKTYEQKNKKVYTLRFEKRMLDQIIEDKLE